jgi:signal transduction histidine kinase
MHLYRITQEAINNAVKHGEAKNISIVLTSSEGNTRLVIADDGKGVPEMGSGTRGIGLHSMTYRARAVGGALKIDSKPNEGTIVVCEIPEHKVAVAAQTP